MGIYDGLDVPQSIKDLAELPPYVEVALRVLRDGIKDIPVYSKIPPAQVLAFPFILVYRTRPMENWRGDPRFLDAGHLTVSVFTEDPDGMEKAELISEAVRVVMRNAWFNKPFYPGLGSVVRIEMKVDPTRSPDWETSAGPVQFADLPGGTSRYFAEYEMVVRKPRIYPEPPH